MQSHIGVEKGKGGLMNNNIEIITPAEWERRMLIDEIYRVLNIKWGVGYATTRVMSRETGEIFDVTGKTVGGKIVLEVKKLE